MFIDVLSEVVTTGLRKLFSVITFDGLVKDVSSSIDKRIILAVVIRP